MPAPKYRLPLPQLANEYGCNEKTLRRYAAAGVDIDDPTAVGRARALRNSDQITPISVQIADLAERPAPEPDKPAAKTKRKTSKRPTAKLSDVLAGLPEEERAAKARELAALYEQAEGTSAGSLPPGERRSNRIGLDVGNWRADAQRAAFSQRTAIVCSDRTLA